MNRLAAAATMLLPSVAFAHPGHSHEGMSENHHLLFAGAGILAAVAVGWGVRRILQAKRDR